MEDRQFTMSMYQSKEDLYRAKALYFEDLYEESVKHVKRLRIIEEHRDILAKHMGVVMAIADGSADNTLGDVAKRYLEEFQGFIDGLTHE